MDGILHYQLNHKTIIDLLVNECFMFNAKQDKLLPSLFHIEDPFQGINQILSDANKNISFNVNAHKDNITWSNFEGCYGTYCGDLEQLNHETISVNRQQKVD